MMAITNSIPFNHKLVVLTCVSLERLLNVLKHKLLGNWLIKPSNALHHLYPLLAQLYGYLNPNCTIGFSFRRTQV